MDRIRFLKKRKRKYFINYIFYRLESNFKTAVAIWIEMIAKNLEAFITYFLSESISYYVLMYEK